MRRITRVRSGITITSGYAIRQCSRLVKSAAKGGERDELASLQMRLESKIRIISPAIDMIELIAARGNTSLESAVSLTKALRWDIQSLGVRLAKAATEEELLRRGSSKAKSKASAEAELKSVIVDIKRLLTRIEDAVPLINLAITTSGVSLSTTLPTTVSPSRLLQASTFLTAGDSRYAMDPSYAVQIGPAFTLSMYMLFAGHANRPYDEDGVRETTWKEVIHKARVKLMRVSLNKLYDLPPPAGQLLARSINGNTGNGDGDGILKGVPSEGKAFEFAYHLLIIEDLDDDRVHTFEDDEVQPEPCGDIAQAGIREVLPIHEVSKIFYADTGKILNIGTEGETNNPVLLLKRDVNAVPPRRMMKEENSEPQWYDETSIQTPSSPGADIPSSPVPLQDPGSDEPPVRKRTDPWQLPPNLDPEWIAFEVYAEEIDTENEEDSSMPVEGPGSSHQLSRSRSLDPELTKGLSDLKLQSHTTPSTPSFNSQNQVLAPPSPHQTAPTSLPALRTSLSLLELLTRLTALQQFQQQSHLSITDELLNFFLSEAGTHGAGGDAENRRRVRRAARQKVGFDPYDESPIKRRGEEYVREHGRSTYGDEGGWEESSRRGSRTGTPRFEREFSPGSAMAPVYPSAEGGARYNHTDSGVGAESSTRSFEPRKVPMSLSHVTGYTPGSESAYDAPSPSPLLRKSTRSRAATPALAPSKGRPDALLREKSGKASPSLLGKSPTEVEEATDSGMGSRPS